MSNEITFKLRHAACIHIDLMELNMNGLKMHLSCCQLAVLIPLSLTFFQHTQIDDKGKENKSTSTTLKVVVLLMVVLLMATKFVVLLMVALLMVTLAAPLARVLEAQVGVKYL